MFALLQHLIGTSGPETDQTAPAPRPRRASATPLGYQYVDLDLPSTTPVPYPPLTDLRIDVEDQQA